MRNYNVYYFDVIDVNILMLRIKLNLVAELYVCRISNRKKRRATTAVVFGRMTLLQDRSHTRLQIVV